MRRITRAYRAHKVETVDASHTESYRIATNVKPYPLSSAPSLASRPSIEYIEIHKISSSWLIDLDLSESSRTLSSSKMYALYRKRSVVCYPTNHLHY